MSHDSDIRGGVVPPLRCALGVGQMNAPGKHYLYSVLFTPSTLNKLDRKRAEQHLPGYYNGVKFTSLT